MRSSRRRKNIYIYIYSNSPHSCEHFTKYAVFNIFQMHTKILFYPRPNKIWNYHFNFVFSYKRNFSYRLDLLQKIVTNFNS